MRPYDDDPEEGEYADYPNELPSIEEIKAAAALIVFIEYELEIDVKRLRIRVRENTTYVQGNVSSHKEKKLIEKELPLRPNVGSIEFSISVHRPMD